VYTSGFSWSALLLLLLLLLLLQVDAAHVCYLVAGVTPTPLDAGPAARMLLLGINHTTIAGQRAMRQLLPLMRSEVYEWARSLAGGECCAAIHTQAIQ
jgi:hypothetical protein